MKPYAKLYALVLAALWIALALPAAAQPPTNDPSTAYSLLHHPRALAKLLHLSSSQTTQLLGFYNTLEQTVEPLRQARAPLCTQLITDLTANPPQPDAVGTDSINLYESKQQILGARKTFDTSFSAILDPAQLTAYDALKALALFTDPEVNVIGDCPRPTS
jgi:inactivated superfamily I helicase